MFNLREKLMGGTASQRGQTIVGMALGAVVVLVFVGLAIDTAALYSKRAGLKRAADSAALAAASRLLDEGETAALDAAADVARLHGYDPALFSVTFPREGKVEVEVSGSVDTPLSFMRLIQQESSVVASGGVSAEVVTIDDAMPYDLVLVVDTSTSMSYDEDSCGSSVSYCNLHDCCQPMRGVKDAALALVGEMDPVRSRLSVVSYARESDNHQELTHNYSDVSNAVDGLQVWDGACPCTNIGDGIAAAIAELDARGSESSAWAIVLLTDGRANAWGDGEGNVYQCGSGAGCTEAQDWARQQAWEAANRDITIYAVSLGEVAIQYNSLMVDIADISDNGQVDGFTENQFDAEDVDDLLDVFRRILYRFVRLTR